MTKDRIGVLRAGLVQRLDALRAEIGAEATAEASTHYRDVAGEVTDIGDASSGAEIVGTDNAIIGRHMEEVRDIEAALARMDAGTYGRCVDCGTRVDLARLAAYPTAKRCLRCQGVHEKTFAGGARPSL